MLKAGKWAIIPVLILGLLLIGPAYGVDESRSPEKPVVSASGAASASSSTDIEGNMNDSLEDSLQYKIITDQTKITFRSGKGRYEDPSSRIRVYGDIVIDTDSMVEKSIFSNGNITVKGLVQGDVVTPKKIRVTSSGEITGDAMGMEVTIEDGGIVGGNVIETNLTDLPSVDFLKDKKYIEIFQRSYTPIITTTILLAILLFFAFLSVAAFPKAIDRVSDCIQMSPFKSFIIGFVFWLLYGPLFGLLVITIIGIPIAVLGLPLATLVAAIIGFTALAHVVAGWFKGYFGLESRMFKSLFGIVVLWLPWIIMALFEISPSGVSDAFAVLFLVIAIIVTSIGGTTAVGAVILTRFATRDCEKGPTTIKVTIDTAPPPPTPPPINRPDAPPPPTPPPLSGEENDKGDDENR